MVAREPGSAARWCPRGPGSRGAPGEASGPSAARLEAAPGAGENPFNNDKTRFFTRIFGAHYARHAARGDHAVFLGFFAAKCIAAACLPVTLLVVSKVLFSAPAASIHSDVFAAVCLEEILPYLVVIACVAALFESLEVLARRESSRRVETSISKAALNRVLSADLLKLEDSPTMHIRAEKEIRFLRVYIGDALGQRIEGTARIVVASIILFVWGDELIYSSVLGLGCVLGVVIYALHASYFSLRLRKVLFPRGWRPWHGDSQLRTLMAAACLERDVIRLIDEVYVRHVESNNWIAPAMFLSLLTFAGSVFFGAFYWIAALGVASGMHSRAVDFGGVFLAATEIALILYSAVILQSTQALSKKFFLVLKQYDNVPEWGTLAPSNLPAENVSTESVKLSNVCLGTKSLTLDNITLELLPDKVYVLVGPGASLLLKTMAKLYQPSSGTVALPAEHTSTLVHPIVIWDHTSIADNLRLGGSQAAAASREELVLAAQEAHADEFISGLSHGYLTRMDETELSTDQRFRIGLARCLVKRPKILLMDCCEAPADDLLLERLLISSKREKRLVVLAVNEMNPHLEHLVDQCVVLGQVSGGHSSTSSAAAGQKPRRGDGLRDPMLQDQDAFASSSASAPSTVTRIMATGTPSEVKPFLQSLPPPVSHRTSSDPGKSPRVVAHSLVENEEEVQTQHPQSDPGTSAGEPASDLELFNLDLSWRHTGMFVSFTLGALFTLALAAFVYVSSTKLQLIPLVLKGTSQWSCTSLNNECPKRRSVCVPFSAYRAWHGVNRFSGTCTWACDTVLDCRVFESGLGLGLAPRKDDAKCVHLGGLGSPASKVCVQEFAQGHSSEELSSYGNHAFALCLLVSAFASALIGVETRAYHRAADDMRVKCVELANLNALRGHGEHWVEVEVVDNFVRTRLKQQCRAAGAAFIGILWILLLGGPFLGTFLLLPGLLGATAVLNAGWRRAADFRAAPRRTSKALEASVQQASFSRIYPSIKTRFHRDMDQERLTWTAADRKEASLDALIFGAMNAVVPVVSLFGLLVAGVAIQSSKSSALDLASTASAIVVALEIAWLATTAISFDASRWRELHHDGALRAWRKLNASLSASVSRAPPASLSQEEGLRVTLRNYRFPSRVVTLHLEPRSVCRLALSSKEADAAVDDLLRSLIMRPDPAKSEDLESSVAPRVLLNEDVELRAADLRWFKRRAAVCGPRIVLRGSVRSNLSGSHSTLEDDRLIRALRAARADRLVDFLDADVKDPSVVDWINRYHWRLSLARAVARSASLLVVDRTLGSEDDPEFDRILRDCVDAETSAPLTVLEIVRERALALAAQRGHSVAAEETVYV